jgi:hypothetical protein
MVKFTVGLLFAAAVAAPALINAAPLADIESRDVAASQDMFGRAVESALADVYSRDELEDIFGRDYDDLSARDLEELFDREIEIDDSIFARDSDDFEARGFFSNIKNTVKGWFKPKTPAPVEEAPPAARDFDDEFEARAAAPAPVAAPKPHEPNLIEKFLNLFRNANHKGAAAKKPAPKEKAAPKADAAAEAAAPPAEEAAAPAERDFEEYFEREMYERDLEDMYERELDEMFEREIDADLYERTIEEDLLERDYEDEVFERAQEEMELLERELGLEGEMYERELEDLLERELLEGDLFERDFSFDELD